MSNDNRSDSIWNRDIGDIADDAFNKLLKLSNYIQEKERISLDNFIKQHSRNIDKCILKIEKEENISFVGGIFSIKVESDELMTINFDLYFKDRKTSKFINKKGSDENIEMRLYLDDPSIEKLIQHKMLSLEIDPPKSK